jgi:antitoxin (DNA-binding transcriptional repressor) of toxin-antitoxin stability system
MIVTISEAQRIMSKLIKLVQNGEIVTIHCR